MATYYYRGPGGWGDPYKNNNNAWVLTATETVSSIVTGPFPTDDVVFDELSPPLNVNIVGTRYCKNLTMTGWAGSFSATPAGVSLLIYGDSVVLSNQGTFISARNPTTYFVSGGTTYLTTNGQTMGNVTVNSGTTLVLLDDFAMRTSNSTLIINSGTFNANNHSVTIGQLYTPDTTDTKVINMGNKTWNLMFNGGINYPEQSLALGNITSVTINPNTSKLRLVKADEAVTLKEDITSTTQDTIRIFETGNWPLTGYFLIDDEEMYYSGISEGVATISARGTHGTKAATHTAGTPVILLSPDNVTLSENTIQDLGYYEQYTEMTIANNGSLSGYSNFNKSGVTLGGNLAYDTLSIGIGTWTLASIYYQVGGDNSCTFRFQLYGKRIEQDSVYSIKNEPSNYWEAYTTYPTSYIRTLLTADATFTYVNDLATWTWYSPSPNGTTIPWQFVMPRFTTYVYPGSPEYLNIPAGHRGFTVKYKKRMYYSGPSSLNPSINYYGYSNRISSLSNSNFAACSISSFFSRTVNIIDCYYRVDLDEKSTTFVFSVQGTFKLSTDNFSKELRAVDIGKHSLSSITNNNITIYGKNATYYNYDAENEILTWHWKRLSTNGVDFVWVFGQPYWNESNQEFSIASQSSTYTPTNSNIINSNGGWFYMKETGSALPYYAPSSGNALGYTESKGNLLAKDYAGYKQSFRDGSPVTTMDSTIFRSLGQTFYGIEFYSSGNYQRYYIIGDVNAEYIKNNKRGIQHFIFDPNASITVNKFQLTGRNNQPAYTYASKRTENDYGIERLRDNGHVGIIRTTGVSAVWYDYVGSNNTIRAGFVSVNASVFKYTSEWNYLLTIVDPATNSIVIQPTVIPNNYASTATSEVHYNRILEIVNTATPGHILVLSSFAYTRCNTSTRQALLLCGSTATNQWSGSVGHVFVGKVGGAPGTAFEMISYDNANCIPGIIAELTVAYDSSGNLYRLPTPSSGTPYSTKIEDFVVSLYVDWPTTKEYTITDAPLWVVAGVKAKISWSSNYIVGIFLSSTTFNSLYSNFGSFAGIAEVTISYISGAPDSGLLPYKDLGAGDLL